MVACVLGALDSHDWSTHYSSLDWSTHDSSIGALGAFGSAPHDGLFLEVFGLPVHELSTRD